MAKQNTDVMIAQIDAIAATHCSTVGQIASLLSCEDGLVTDYLFTKAAAVRDDIWQGKIQIRAIIEFSNVCRCGCVYCGINNKNQEVCRYRMEPEEIFTLAKSAIDAGYRTVVLQSGEDLYYTQEMIGQLVQAIKDYASNVAVTLSMGERSKEDYAAWREAGADRYLIKHETADPTLYEWLHPGHTLAQRLVCQKNLRELGYELGSGFMVGLPGQTMETLAQDILLLQTMQVAMAGIGPFIPHPGTPLGQCPSGKIRLTNKALALSRLLLPRVHLPATTALTVQGGRGEALAAGANVIMQKATPEAQQRLYEIYPRQVREEYPLKEKRRLLVEQLKSLGYTGV